MNFILKSQKEIPRTGSSLKQPLKQPLKQQQGLSLIELLLVLAAFAVMLTLIFVGNKWRTVHTQSLEAEDSIVALFKSAQNVMSNQINFTNLSMSTISGLRDFPSVLGSGSTYHMPWGGSVTIGPSSSPADTNDLVAITMTNVPIGQCQQIATVISPKIYDTTINGQVVALTPPPTTEMPGRANVDFSKLQADCTDSNTMVFRQLKNLDPSLFVEFDDINRNVFTLNTALAAQLARRRAAIQARETVQAGL